MKEEIAKIIQIIKGKGMGVQQVVNVLVIANNDLPTIKSELKG